MTQKISTKIVWGMVLSICFLGFFASASAESLPIAFSDVPQDSRFFIPIAFLKQKNIIQEFSDNTFHPERKVSRAEALVMILKATNTENGATTHNLLLNFAQPTTVTAQDPETGENIVYKDAGDLRIDVDNGKAKLKIIKKIHDNPFSDVSEKDWFYEAVVEGKRREIIKGTGGGKYFKPKKSVNLAEALRMLFKASSTVTELTEMPMPTGVQPNAWYAKDMAYAANLTIITQQQDGSIFPPHKKLTRGELALLLYRFFKTKEDASFGYASWYKDGLAKTELTTGKEYADQHLTAAHRTLPFETIVRVTNMTNGKQVEVVINDRGPFVTGRIIDLSKTAFSALESPTVGIMSVQIEKLSH